MYYINYIYLRSCEWTSLFHCYLLPLRTRHEVLPFTSAHSVYVWLGHAPGIRVQTLTQHGPTCVVAEKCQCKLIDKLIMVRVL